MLTIHQTYLIIRRSICPGPNPRPRKRYRSLALGDLIIGIFKFLSPINVTKSLVDDLDSTRDVSGYDFLSRSFHGRQALGHSMSSIFYSTDSELDLICGAGAAATPGHHRSCPVKPDLLLCTGTC
jgi:hypothetical protein